VFPSASRDSHLNKNTAKDQHKKAIDDANAKARKDDTKPLKHFSHTSFATLR